MAAKNQKDPARNGTPVIHKLTVAHDDGRARLLNRQAPAWLISGMIHIVLIATFIAFDQFSDHDIKARTKGDPPTSTLVDEKPEKDPILINPDEGPALDQALSLDFGVAGDPSTASPMESEVPSIGPMQELNSSDIAKLGLTSDKQTEPGATNPALTGAGTPADGGPGSGIAAIISSRRNGPVKAGILKEQGGSPETEAAVGKALIWLAKQQNVSGGYWEFDGTQKNNHVAATGMCLLPFLAAGETHKSGTKYKETVARGLNYLRSQIKPTGELHPNMYAQAIATIALCEAAGMTHDDSLKRLARAAVDYIVNAQSSNGSWGYTTGTDGDTSIVGWQIQALKSARLADIPVPQRAFDQAAVFLESVASDSGATYGYRSKGSTVSLTAVGLLSRQYMGWTPRNPALARGVDYLWTTNPPTEKDFNIYYIYYATQVVHFFGGPVWHRDWNPKMQQMLLGLQITDKTVGAKAADIGSWPRDNNNGHIADSCGKLGTTAMCCLTLEVYYRHLPLYKRDNAGLDALEK